MYGALACMALGLPSCNSCAVASREWMLVIPGHDTLQLPLGDTSAWLGWAAAAPEPAGDSTSSSISCGLWVGGWRLVWTPSALTLVRSLRPPTEATQVALQRRVLWVHGLVQGLKVLGACQIVKPTHPPTPRQHTTAMHIHPPQPEASNTTSTTQATRLATSTQLELNPHTLPHPASTEPLHPPQPEASHTSCVI